MKLSKIVVLTLLVALIIACGSGAAWAQVYDDCVDALVELGLFQGTANGYELDRAPTRAEAAAMLVRLLGAEEEALTARYAHPFTDLKGWESPYVGYLYEKGLTTGMTATAFAPQQPCSSQMFCTFILRALGYGSGEGGDFTYANAAEFAVKLGVADVISLGFGDFSRDGAVGIAYTALATPMKAGGKEPAPLLLQYLVDSGAVAKEKAAPYLRQFAAYAALQQAMRSLAYHQDGMEVNFDMELAMGMIDGETAAGMAMALSSNIKAAGDPYATEFVLAMDNLLALTGDQMEGIEDQIVTFNIYLKDDVVYLRMDMGEDGIVKYKLDLAAFAAGLAELDEASAAAVAQYQDLLSSLTAMMPEDPYTGHYGVALMGPITVAKNGADTVYRVDMRNMEGYINETVKSLVGSSMAGSLDAETVLALDSLEYRINGLTADYIVGKNGTLKKVAVAMDMSCQALEQTVSMKGMVVITLVRSGSGVQVKLPDDLDEYVNMDTMYQGLLEPAV